MDTITAPRRWKTPDEFTDQEARTHARLSGRAHVPPRFETDEWREHAERLRESLSARRAAAEREVHEAQRALGSAVVDQASGATARKRLDAARSELEALDHAEEESRLRDADEQRRYEEVAEHASCARAYRWYVAYLTAAEEVLRARAAMLAAEERLAATGSSGRVANSFRRILEDEELGIDLELLHNVPRQNGITDRVKLGGDSIFRGKFRDTGSLTAERCAELRAKAERLALVEEQAAS